MGWRLLAASRLMGLRPVIQHIEKIIRIMEFDFCQLAFPLGDPSQYLLEKGNFLGHQFGNR